MSLKAVKNEIELFLASAEPTVMCISGKWGVGKTYTWTKIWKEHKPQPASLKLRYSYVSLYGCNSIEDMKKAIVEGGGAELMETLVGSGANKWFSKIAGNSPAIVEYAKKYFENKFLVSADVLYQSVFSCIRKSVICVDDLERAGADLKVEDVLALVSKMKIEYGCRIALLLNASELGDDKKRQFEAQIEKVCDSNLHFNPTPQEAAELGISESKPYREALTHHIVNLEVTNLRTVQRMVRESDKLSTLLETRDPRTLSRAIQTAALAVFVKFHPSEAPSFDDVRKNGFAERLSRRLSGNNLSEVERKHEELLGRYNFGDFTAFDNVVFSEVRLGYFDESELDTAAKEQDRLLLITDGNNTFREAWGLFHNSFDNNLSEVVEAFCKSIETNFEVISPANLNATIRKLKELGQADRATRALAIYVTSRQEKSDFWNLKSGAYDGMWFEPIDEDVKEAFEAKFNSFFNSVNLAELLGRIGRYDSYSEIEVRYCASLSVEQIVEALKALTGENIQDVRRELANHSRAMNEKYRNELTSLVEAALREIAKESLINSVRVKNVSLNLGDGFYSLAPSANGSASK